MEFLIALFGWIFLGAAFAKYKHDKKEYDISYQKHIDAVKSITLKDKNEHAKIINNGTDEELISSWREIWKDRPDLLQYERFVRDTWIAEAIFVINKGYLPSHWTSYGGIYPMGIPIIDDFDFSKINYYKENGIDYWRVVEFDEKACETFWRWAEKRFRDQGKMVKLKPPERWGHHGGSMLWDGY